MVAFAETQAGYRNLWRSVDYAHPSMSRGALLNQIDHIIDRGLTGRAAYEAVQKRTGVPWWWILPVHYREGNLNFHTHLHNGDPLSGYTTHVPAGRPHVGHGPPFSWDESAADALNMRQLSLITQWSPERALYEWEGDNGWGYFGRINSPYVWAWSSHYSGGKITRDHGPIESVYDQQCGCAVIFKRMIDRGLITIPDLPTDDSQADRPYRYSGVITLDGVDYQYATGGLGRGSAPYGGPWKITPDAVGPIGLRLGAIGLADGQIDDSKYPGQPRIGIEIHPGERDDLLRSEGCIVLQPSVYPSFKAKLLADAARETQYLTINPDGHIVIGPAQKEPPVTTPTPIALPTQQIDLAAVEHTFELINPFLPWLTPVFPAAPAIVLSLEGLLKAAAAVQQGQNLFAVLPTALHDVATQLESLAPKKGA